MSEVQSKNRQGWSWFDREASPEDEAGQPSDAGDLPDPGRTLRQAYARCFSGAEGEQVLAHLRAITLERALGPGAPDQTLRHIEGQRQLVSYITQLTERGRDGR